MARINATCRDYVGMSEAERKDVIIAMGGREQARRRQPGSGVRVAAALCNFVDPARAGEGRRHRRHEVSTAARPMFPLRSTQLPGDTPCRCGSSSRAT